MILNFARFLIYVFWAPYFHKFRWVLLLLPLLFSYSGFLLANFSQTKRADLEIVTGVYQAPLLGSKTDTYSTRVKTASGEIVTCNCDPGGRGNSNCLHEKKTKNREMIQALNGKEVAILMARKRFYEYNRLCYEIRINGKAIVPYQELNARYLRQKSEFNFDRAMFFTLCIIFFLITCFRSLKFFKEKPWQSPISKK